jgi:hypothetical protein
MASTATKNAAKYWGVENEDKRLQHRQSDYGPGHQPEQAHVYPTLAPRAAENQEQNEIRNEVGHHLDGRKGKTAPGSGDRGIDHEPQPNFLRQRPSYVFEWRKTCA